jgi:hypothetical protein
MVETLRSLPADQKEVFAFGFHTLTTKLQTRISDFLAHREAMPTELPDPLPQPNVLFKKKRTRGYTGAEAAEENEKDARRAQKQAERDAEDQRREGDRISQDLRQEHMTRHKEAEKDIHRKEIQEHTATVVERRRHYGLVALADSDLTPDPDPLSEEDVSMEDADSDIGALDFLDNMEDTGEMEIGGPLGMGDHLATSSSDELSDPPITQVAENETDSESESADEVIPSSYPPEASTSIQVPATTPTSTAPPSTRSSIRSKKHTRKFESQYARDVVAIEAKKQRRKQREAKANRTGIGRTKAVEALAQTSQLLTNVELLFRSSQ